MSGFDWSKVEGRHKGSLGLSLTVAYSLGDPQMTGNAKKVGMNYTIGNIKKVLWPKFKKKTKIYFFHIWTIFFQFKPDIKSKQSWYIFRRIIVVYYYKFLCEESPWPNRPPCTSGVVFGRVCVCSLRSRLVFFKFSLYLKIFVGI